MPDGYLERCIADLQCFFKLRWCETLLVNSETIFAPYDGEPRHAEDENLVADKLVETGKGLKASKQLTQAINMSVSSWPQVLSITARVYTRSTIRGVQMMNIEICVATRSAELSRKAMMYWKGLKRVLSRSNIQRWKLGWCAERLANSLRSNHQK